MRFECDGEHCVREVACKSVRWHCCWSRMTASPLSFGLTVECSISWRNRLIAHGPAAKSTLGQSRIVVPPDLSAASQRWRRSPISPARCLEQQTYSGALSQWCTPRDLHCQQIRRTQGSQMKAERRRNSWRSRAPKLHHSSCSSVNST